MYDWGGKNVLVTGGAGMIGSALVERLLGLGASVRVFDNFSRGKTTFEAAENEGIDVTNGPMMQALLAMPQKHPDVVFNLAAEVAGVQFNQGNQAMMFCRNLALQIEPLQAALVNGVKRFVQVSSVCVYGPGNNSPAVEDLGWGGDPTPANAGYAWAKRMGETYARFCVDAGLDVVIVRPTNAYGPRDYFDERAHVIPAMVSKFVEHWDSSTPVQLNGSGLEEREFIHAADVAAGMVAAAERGVPGEAYNLGTGGATRVSMRALADLVRDLTNRIATPVEWAVHYDPGDDRRWTDANKAEEDLGWNSAIGLEEGVREVVAWYLENRGGGCST